MNPAHLKKLHPIGLALGVVKPNLIFWLCVLSASLLLLLSGCTQTSISAQPPVNISIAGSTSFSPVLFDLTEAFVAQNPNVTFDIRGGGSRFGEEQLRDGKVDFAATTYLVTGGQTRTDAAIVSPSASTSSQIESADTADQDAAPSGISVSAAGEQAVPVRIPIALDGLAVVVNQNNQLESLSLTQLQDVFNGRILNWEEVDGTPDEIQLVVREDDSGAQKLFEERVMGDKLVSLTAVIMPSNIDVLQFVAVHPNAIGYISRGYVAQRIEAGQLSDAEGDASDIELGTERQAEGGVASASSIGRNGLFDVGGSNGNDTRGFLEPFLGDRNRVKAVAIDGRLPTVSNLSDQQYLLIQPMYLVSAGEPTAWRALFIDFVLGPGGQAIVRRYHMPVR